MKGIIDHFIISIYDLENEIKQDLIERNLKTRKDSDEEIDNALYQLFEKTLKFKRLDNIQH